MNPTFYEWIQGQSPENWGLDAATIQMITDYYHFREICDTEKMPVFFWRDINMYRDRYKAQIRLEAANASIDPLVSRYFEAEFKAERSGTSQNSRTAQENTRNTNTGQLIYSQPEETRDIWNESVTNGHNDATTEYADRKRVHEISGVKKHSTSGDATKNFTQDGSGSEEEIRYGKIRKTQEKGTSGDSGSTSENRIQDDRHIVKTAPMNAQGAGHESKTLSNKTGSITISIPGQPQYTYLSEAREDGSNSGVYGAHENSATSSSDRGTTDSGSDTHIYRRKQQTGTDITEQDSYDNYKETDTESGKETVTTNYGEDKAGDHTITTTKSNQETVDDASGQRDSEGTENGTTSNREMNRNRYTGREGLTPQAGLESALRYLQTMPQAISWLIGILEHNFIGVYDL